MGELLWRDADLLIGIEADVLAGRITSDQAQKNGNDAAPDDRGNGPESTVVQPYQGP